ncbi:MAG: metallopeptidase family protein [Anaerolineales bacterium]
MNITPKRFEQLVDQIAAEVLAELPPALRADAEQVLVDIEDWAAPDKLAQLGVPPGHWLFGLYEGVPMVQRRSNSVIMQPDRITLYRGPIQNSSRTEAEIRRHIRRTFIHELGHFFGFDEHELAARGWG